MSRPAVRRRVIAAIGTTAAVAFALAACDSSNGSTTSDSHHGAMPHPDGSPSGATPSMGDMPGMNDAATARNGLADTLDGYRLTFRHTRVVAGRATRYRFSITGPDGRPVTDFAVEQTRRMHLYAIRSDLTGFQHLHPTMATDGTWSADVAALSPGDWRMFTSFVPGSGRGKGRDFVLSSALSVPGTRTTVPLPAAASSAQVDGYTVSVTGEPMAGMAHPLTVTITRNGTPVDDLEPYLDTYAHLTAFHETDAAFAHLHPQTPVHGDHGGPSLSFHAELPESGNWRLFLQFRTGGRLHTAAVTMHVA